MSAGAIKTVTVKKQEYVLTNLNEIIPRKIREKNVAFVTTQITGVAPKNINRIMKVGDAYFVYDVNNKLYKATESLTCSSMGDLTYNITPTILFAYTENMGQAYYVLSSNRGILYYVADIVKTNLPTGLYGENYKGRIYVGTSNSLMVSKVFDYKNGETNFKFYDRFYTVPGDNAYMIGLFAIGGKLFYMNANSFYEVSVSYDGKTKKFKKLSLPPFNAVKSSAIKIGDKYVVFVSNARIMVFDGQTLSVRKTKLDNEAGVTFSSYGGSATYYLTTVKIKNNFYTYAYDVFSGEEYFTNYNKLVSNEDGYAVDMAGNRLIKFSVTYREINENTATELTEDLGYCGSKTITGFEIHVNGTGEIVFSGDFGEKKFNLNSGCNIVRCNMGSKTYKIKLQNVSSDFTVEKAKLKYRQCGE